MRYLTKKEKLSNFLIRERLRRGLSQQEVADEVEASLRNYQRWESGETFPQPYYWLKLQDFFGECINEVTVFDVQEHPLQDRLLAGDQEDKRALSLAAIFRPILVGLLNEYVGVKGNELRPYVHVGITF